MATSAGDGFGREEDDRTKKKRRWRQWQFVAIGGDDDGKSGRWLDREAWQHLESGRRKVADGLGGGRCSKTNQDNRDGQQVAFGGR